MTNPAATLLRREEQALKKRLKAIRRLVREIEKLNGAIVRKVQHHSAASKAKIARSQRRRWAAKRAAKA